MSKQTKIRDKIDKEVAIELCLYCKKNDQDPDNTCDDTICPCEASLVTAKTIRGIYHEHGVVIKVERELPELDGYSPANKRYYRFIQQDMLRAGYIAVEPLIGEEK